MARRLLLGCSAVGNTLVERTREARGELIAITDDTGWASTLRDRNVATVEADPTDPRRTQRAPRSSWLRATTRRGTSPPRRPHGATTRTQ